MKNKVVYEGVFEEFSTFCKEENTKFVYSKITNNNISEIISVGNPYDMEETILDDYEGKKIRITIEVLEDEK